MSESLVRPLDKEATDRLNRRIQEEEVAKATKDFDNTKRTEEVAQFAINEYENGIYRQDQETINGEIALAEADVARSTEALDFVKRLKSTSNDVISAEWQWSSNPGPPGQAIRAHLGPFKIANDWACEQIEVVVSRDSSSVGLHSDFRPFLAFIDSRNR